LCGCFGIAAIAKGDAGNDLLFGGSGNDILAGGEGDDQLNGEIDRGTRLIKRTKGLKN